MIAALGFSALALLSLPVRTLLPRPIPAPVPAGDPREGTYDLVLTTNGAVLNGRLLLKRADSSFTGTIEAGVHALPITAMSKQGDAWVLTAGAEGFTVEYTLTFDGDSLSGSFKTGDGMSGTVTGQRVKTPADDQ